MALTKEQVKEAFREAVLKDYEDVPPADEIDHVFSARFYQNMKKLIDSLRAAGDKEL